MTIVPCCPTKLMVVTITIEGSVTLTSRSSLDSSVEASRFVSTLMVSLAAETIETSGATMLVFSKTIVSLITTVAKSPAAKFVSVLSMLKVKSRSAMKSSGTLSKVIVLVLSQSMAVKTTRAISLPAKSRTMIVTSALGWPPHKAISNVAEPSLKRVCSRVKPVLTSPKLLLPKPKFSSVRSLPSTPFRITMGSKKKSSP